MSTYVPTKHHLREAVLLYYNQKKNASECHRLILETYPDCALSIRMCQQWFSRFRSGDFDLTDKERTGQPKKFKNEELEALLVDDPYRSVKELAKIFNVDKSTISRRLNALRVIRKRGKWVQNE